MNYDALPYPSLPVAQTHPERLATAVTLLGMRPAPVDRCRVLELGCASGGNLLPMAAALPGSRFLGVDLSARQVAAGQALLAESGLTNVELRTADLTTLLDDPPGGPALGEFDYILAHGVYSWVPESVQRAMLELCRKRLAPQGIAYISYNTLPGFYRRQPIRDMMRYHVANLAQDGQPLPPAVATQHARELLERLAQSVPNPGGSSVWSLLLKQEHEHIRQLPDSYLAHEHLEEDNRPCYFHEFAARAASHGLQYATEAERLGTVDDFPPGMDKLLRSLGDDLIKHEQYLDFVRHQSLRCSILCRAEVQLERSLSSEPARTLRMSANAWPATDSPPKKSHIRSGAAVPFRSRLGQVTVPDPGYKAVLLALHNSRPRALSFAELGELAGELVGDTYTDEALADIVMHAYRTGLLKLHVQPPRMSVQVSERPRATGVARTQARQHLTVTNLWHQTVELDPLERVTLSLLDGEHDVAALLNELVQAVRSGVLVVERAGAGTLNEPALRDMLSARLPTVLTTFATTALLVD